AEQIVRQYAGIIRANAGISNSLKEALGVRPANNSRAPIPAPETSTLLNVIAATPGSQTLRYADSMTPQTGRRPVGAIGLMLYVAVGTATTINPDDARFYGMFTRNPVGVAFGPADNGKQATHFARWTSRRGELGPWSAPVTLAIAA